MVISDDRPSWLDHSKFIRAFKWGTVHPCGSRGCKTARGQSSRSQKKCRMHFFVVKMCRGPFIYDVRGFLPFLTPLLLSSDIFIVLLYLHDQIWLNSPYHLTSYMDGPKLLSSWNKIAYWAKSNEFIKCLALISVISMVFLGKFMTAKLQQVLLYHFGKSQGKNEKSKQKCLWLFLCLLFTRRRTAHPIFKVLILLSNNGITGKPFSKQTFWKKEYC